MFGRIKDRSYFGGDPTDTWNKAYRVASPFPTEKDQAPHIIDELLKNYNSKRFRSNELPEDKPWYPTIPYVTQLREKGKPNMTPDQYYMFKVVRGRVASQILEKFYYNKPERVLNPTEKDKKLISGVFSRATKIAKGAVGY